MHILVVSHNEELHTVAVKWALEERGHVVDIFDLEVATIAQDFSQRISVDGCTFKLQGRKFYHREVRYTM